MTDKETREERLTLSAKRDKIYDSFRKNLRLLRHDKELSAVELCAELTMFKSGKFIIDIEYGRANPTIEQVIELSRYFNVPMDDLMNKSAKITFN